MSTTAPTFEVQRLHKKQWSSVSLYADEAGAREAAKALLAADPPAEGVRITREAFDEATKRFATTVIFRSTDGDSAGLEAEPDPRTAARRAPPPAAAAPPLDEPVRPAARPRGRMPPLWLLLAGVAVVLAVTGLLWPHGK